MSGQNHPEYRPITEFADQLTPSHALAIDLFNIGQALESGYQLRQALTDPNATSQEREQLVDVLLSGRVSADAVSMVKVAARHSWSSGMALAAAMDYQAIRMSIRASDAEGGTNIEVVRLELLEFLRVVESNPDLLRALDDPYRTLGEKKSLVNDLLASKARFGTAGLARRALQGRQGGYEQRLRMFLDMIAELRARTVTKVTTAVAMTDDQRERMLRELRRIYDVEFDIEEEVDPRVLGGVRVEVQDEVMDGTLAAKLAGASRQIS